MARRAFRSESTKVARAAPRDSASIPMAPLPAKRSSTAASATAPRLPRALKVASRTRSGVGRVAGALRRHQATTPGRSRDDAHLGDRTAGAGYGPEHERSAAARRRRRRPHRPGPRPQRRQQRDGRSACTTSSMAFDADDSQRVAVLTGDEQAFSAGANLRDLPRLRDSGPLGPTRLQLVQAGDRGHRGLVRGRGGGAGGVVRPAGGGRVGADRLPRAALGRAADRRRHLPAARRSSGWAGPST